MQHVNSINGLNCPNLEPRKQFCSENLFIILKTEERENQTGEQGRGAASGQAGFEAKKKKAFRVSESEFKSIPKNVKERLKVQKRKGGFVYIKDRRRQVSDRKK